MKILRVAIILATVLICLPAMRPLFAASTKKPVISSGLKAKLSASAKDEEIPVIVKVTGKVDLRRYKRALRRELVKALKLQSGIRQKKISAFLKENKVAPVRRLWVANSLAFKAPRRVIEALALDPEVEEIRLDSLVHAPEPLPAYVPAPAEWNLDAIKAKDFWTLGYRGEGIVVGIIDTGVDIEHLDLVGRWRGGSNSWYDPNGEHPTVPYDNMGHGTQVTGIVVGGTATAEAIGVSPDSRWIAAKAFNDAGEATISMLGLSFQWMLDPDNNPNTDDAPDILCNSWGLLGTTNQCLPEFDPYFEAADAAGIAHVFSAGNEGPNLSTSVSPANSPLAFASGATDSDNLIAYFSSRGPSACDADIYPKIAAPGVHIRTADLTFAGLFPDSYAYVDGTSFAAPHIAGAMALLLSSLPDSEAPELKFALKKTAFDLGDEGADNDYGFGLANILNAHNRLLDPVPAKAAGLDTDSRQELVIDYGAYGAWIYYNAAEWVKLHDLDPEFLVAGNLDNTGVDDIVFDFGTQGLWVYYNNSSWVKLHDISPEGAIFADLDNNEGRELVIDFGPNYGVWIYYNNSAWRKLHDLSPESIFAANMDGSGGEELIFDYGIQGTWVYYNDSDWLMLHNLSPKTIRGGRFDLNGRDDIIFDFGVYGIWVLYNNSDWSKLQDMSSESIAAADMDNSGLDEIIVDFGEQYGIWVYYNNSEWLKLHDIGPEFIGHADLDGDGAQDMIIGFGGPYGIWTYYDEGAWLKLHDITP